MDKSRYSEALQAPMLVGYARVPTEDPNDTEQLDALKKAGCTKLFIEAASGIQVDRPQLRAALDSLHQGDVFVVWKLYKLSRSAQHLTAIMDELKQRGIGLQSLTEQIDTTSS